MFFETDREIIPVHHPATLRAIFALLLWRLLWKWWSGLIFWPLLVLVQFIRGFVYQELSDWSHYFSRQFWKARRSLSLFLSAVITLVPLKACLCRSRIQMWFNYLWNFNWHGLPVGNAKVSKVIPSRSRNALTHTDDAGCLPAQHAIT